MAKTGNILIIDDNEEFLIALKLMLGPYFAQVTTLNNPELIISEVQKSHYDIILLDMNFRAGINTGNEGLFWLNKIKQVDDDATVVFITAYGDVQLAVQSVKEGATDFIQKSWDEKKILSTVLSAMQLSHSKSEIKKLRSKQQHLSDSISEHFSICKGPSRSMKAIYEAIDKVAVTDANVLITGENGTGKEIIAREIHKLSNRSSEIFVSVDIAALNENLIESELFGHRKGAFTDAKEDRIGRFEVASGGTLFLDEIGNLSMPSQSKLLSILEKRQITRVGHHKATDVDVRLICATNKHIDRMIKEGSFREDLLYRINTIHIQIPALKDRLEDLPALVNCFLKQLRAKYQKPEVSIKKSALNQLLKHEWPGNIRELRHTIEKALIMTSDQFIKPEDLFIHTNEKMEEATGDSFNLAFNEKTLIEKALTKFSWNMSKTAKELGINRSTLYEKIKKYEL